ncbi:hypothetical protein M9Y10_018432 [Tritrichomonas musculus]|uniref:Protein kinase domain-containing protein n=1 Tax=Tritrichomonas musculus TaxID=1915356 RepID=A0ABR2HNT7_9EUKA
MQNPTLRGPPRTRKLTMRAPKAPANLDMAPVRTRKRSYTTRYTKNYNYVVKTANFEELLRDSMNLNEKFVQDFLQGRKLQEGQITQGRKIGSGSFGSVFKTEQITEWKFIIKLPVDKTGIEAMHDEFLRSQSLILKAKELACDSIKSDIFGKLLGLGCIIPVIGQTTDGGIIQELADGYNLFELRKKLGDPDFSFLESTKGFPKEPQEAIQALCSFYYSLHTLQSLDFVHCDIKTQNAILTKDYTIKLIDLGALTKFGEKITQHSATGAPETLYSDKPMLQAGPLYDIYSSAGIFLTMLFGCEGADWDYSLFWPDQDGNTPQYIQMFSNPKVDRVVPVKEIFIDMNDEMGKLGKNYPIEVLDQLSNIFLGITSIDPVDRLYADEVLEQLEDLALSDWANGHYKIISE